MMSVIVFIALLLFTGCGGEEGTPPPATSVSAELIYGPTEGITYLCSSGFTSHTDQSGSFSCDIGNNVSFYLGAVAVATVDVQAGIITPYTLFPDNSNAPYNFVRLLQAMDSDGNTSYGPIVIDPNMLALIPQNIDFASPAFETQIEAALGVSLISISEAETNLNNAILAAGGTIPAGYNTPIANAGIDQTLNSIQISLDGSASYDPDGDSLTYSWSILSKPNGSLISLINPTTSTPGFTADSEGVYSFELIVHDTFGTSAPDTVSITVSNANFPPLANAGIDQNIPTGSDVTLNASSSFDVNGDTLSYSWSVISKPVGSAMSLSGTALVNPVFTADTDGIYILQLIVNDGVYSSLPDLVSVIASTGNSAPVANAGIDLNLPTASVVILDGSASSDADGDSLSYQWSLISAPSGATALLSNLSAVNPYFTAYLDGDYVFGLIVNDGTADSLSDTVTVHTSTANIAPVADAGVDQNLPTSSLVTLDGSGSHDTDGDVLTYNWSVISKPAGSTASLSSTTLVNPTFTADMDGTYILQLIVNDGSLNSLANSVIVTASTANSVPVARAGADAQTYTNIALGLDASASTDGDGDPLSYTWTILSKPAGSTTAALSNPTLVNPDFTPDVSGSYVLQLVVNDGTVSSLADTITVTAIDTQAIKITGQTTSYISFDDGYYQKGAATGYVLASDIVSDSVTGLMWQDDNPTLYDPISGNSAETYCAALSLSGYADWRLPTVYELLTLADRSKSSPAIDATLFRTIGDPGNTYQFWSSTMKSSTERRVVNFTYGDESAVSSTSSYPIRCVRGSSVSSLIQRDDANGIVIDYQSRLVWQDDSNPSKKTWTDAITYCENLSLAGASDWRLPNINELLSVVDFQNSNAVYINVFNYNPDNAWSSTTNPSDSSKAFSVANTTTLFFLSDKPKVSSNESKATSILFPTTKNPKCVRDLP